jgi:hypothetical protein
MKNKIYRHIFLSVFLLSCHRGAKNTVLPVDDNYKMAKNNEQCFTAIFQKDTATLKFNTMPNGKIEGRLVISYGELEPLALKKEFYHGEITGHVTKDTLFADYLFADGAAKTIYRNPMAFLLKDGKLILGVAAIENYLGRNFFVSKIRFNRSRFQFEPAECTTLAQIRPVN